MKLFFAFVFMGFTCSQIQGAMWESGFIQTEKDIRFSDDLSRKAAAGDPEAEFQLGFCYACGFGIEKDYKKAVELWEKSSAQKNAKARNALASAYLRGLGVSRDPQKAFILFYENSTAGNVDALVDLGFLFSRGRGVKRDYARAYQFYKKAADQDEPRALAQLGYFYYAGRGISQDAKKAVDLYRKAIESGQGFGLSYLGVAYDEGQGVEKSVEKAVELFQKAAEKGDPFAQWKLGNLYLSHAGKISMYPGTRHSIGGHLEDVRKEFETKHIPLSKGDTVYLTTDGYIDQFGGTHGKKFMKNMESIKKAQDCLRRIDRKWMRNLLQRLPRNN